MPTTNLKISKAWTQVATSSESDLLVTWEDASNVEFATTTINTAPTVIGHVLTREQAITRGVVGPGYVWARLRSQDKPSNVILVVTK